MFTCLKNKKKSFSTLSDWELIKLFKLIRREGTSIRDNKGQKKTHNKLHSLEHKLVKAMRKRNIDVTLYI